MDAQALDAGAPSTQQGGHGSSPTGSKPGSPGLRNCRHGQARPGPAPSRRGEAEVARAGRPSARGSISSQRDFSQPHRLHPSEDGMDRPAGQPSRLTDSTPYSSRDGSTGRARRMRWVGMVIRGAPSGTGLTLPHGGRRPPLSAAPGQSGQVKSAYSWFRFRPRRRTVMLRKYSTGIPP
jgi:hypothetical protein